MARKCLRCAAAYVGCTPVIVIASCNLPSEVELAENCLEALLDDQPSRPKSPDYNAHLMSTFHKAASIREGHPIYLAGFGRSALAQLPHLFQRRNYQLHPCSLVEKEGFGFLVVQGLGPRRIEDPIVEADQFARFHGAYGEVVNPHVTS
jgi:hypothetical protein